MKIIAGSIALLFHFFVQAQQQTIQGWVKSPDGKALSNVTVLLKDTSTLILHFTRTNTEGHFIFQLVDSEWEKVTAVELHHVGFEKIRQPVQPGQMFYHFQLQAVFRELADVKVKNRPEIISRGDTLSYTVKSFAKQEDRNIGDVIKRLPGMTVDDDGKIYYNNKQIDNLYTDGDNLMDGRYGLATKVIPLHMIQSIDVIQHHQSIEALKGKVNSDKVAVNLVLKDSNKTSLSTQAVLGAGLPAQYDGTLSSILLNKKIKFLNAARANNSGIDYRSDFAQLGSTSMLNDISATRPEPLLSPGTVSNPDLPRRNYYLNRSFVVNINQLFKNKQHTQFRANVQAFTDRQTLGYQSSTRLQLNADTANYNEQQQAVTSFSVMQAAFSVMSNKAKYFLNNKLAVQLQQEKIASSLSTDHLAFNQHLLSKKYSVTNDFSLVPGLKNKAMLELRWMLNYSNNPQKLKVDTGLHKSILNQDLPYEATMQEASVPTFFSDLSAAYQLSKGLIRQNYRAGLLTERQQLNSLLQLQQPGGSITDYERDAGNALHWQRDRFFIQADYSINKPGYEIGLTVPLIAQQIHYKQTAYALDESQKQLFLNPSARIKWMLNKEDYFTVNYAYNNNPGNITGVYRGAVLTNYRSLHASDAALQETNKSNTGFYYNFQRSISMLFMSAGIQYSRNKANFMYSSVITDSIQRVILLPYENTQQNINIAGSFSKYLFSVGGTLAFKIFYQEGRYNQLVNATLLPYNNTSISIIPSWQGRLFRRVNFMYEAFLIKSSSYQKTNKDIRTDMRRIDQQLSLSFSPVKKVNLLAKARHIHSKQSTVSPVDYVFADANIRYTYVKWRTDFELDCSNLLGIKTYEIYRQSANITAQNTYTIRGRMLLLRATFNF